MTLTAPFQGATLEATLERITFANEDNGYTIAKVDTGHGRDLVTVVGSLLGAQPGEALRMRGRWGSHPQYGKQFHVEDYTTVLPATVQGILRYLGSGLIKGIGPKLAEKIVDHFGVASLDVIETTPQRLIEVPNLGPKRTALITAAWEEQKAIKEVMVFLQGVGVSTSLAVRIYKQYADASISVVRNEPYRLATDVWGIGFKTADTIAQAVGIPPDSPQRVKAGLQFTLSEATSDGHCFLPEQELISEAIKVLQVDTGLVIECLAELVTEEGVVREQIPDAATGEPTAAIFLVPFHRAEISLASQLLRLSRTDTDRMPAFAALDWDTALGWLHRRTGTDVGARAGSGGAPGADREGGRAHRRAGVRQELHRPVDRHPRGGEERPDRAGRAHRPRREAAHRADRARGGHGAPPARAPAGRRRRLRQGPPAGRRPRRGRRGVHAGPAAGQQAGQGHSGGGAPAARR